MQTTPRTVIQPPSSIWHRRVGIRRECSTRWEWRSRNSNKSSAYAWGFLVRYYLNIDFPKKFRVNPLPYRDTDISTFFRCDDSISLSTTGSRFFRSVCIQLYNYLYNYLLYTCNYNIIIFNYILCL